jgi:hypothetical protein
VLLAFTAACAGDDSGEAGRAGGDGDFVAEPVCSVAGSASADALACYVIDVDPETQGMQRTRTVARDETFGIDVWVRGVPADPGLGAFIATVAYDRALLRVATPRPAAPIAELTRTFRWDCGITPASAALADDSPYGDGDPATGDAFLACLQTSRTAEPGPGGDVHVARLFMTAIGSGNSRLRVVRGQASLNELGAPLAVDCAVSDEALQAARCLDAEVRVE